MALLGRARDIVTPPSGGEPTVCAQDMFRAVLKSDRTIAAIETEPPRRNAARLVGQRGGGHLRRALDAFMPEEWAGGTPLRLILDDISGVSLVAGWAWSQWMDNWLEAVREARSGSVRDMEGICIGFSPGSSALDPDRIGQPSAGALSPDLRRPDDPEGWHAFPEQDGAAMRRARRIDVRMDDKVRIDAAFQDSATIPETESRAVLHEYSLSATVDSASLRILSLDATPRVLPFPECPSATLNLKRLLGVPLGEMREIVPVALKGTAGCTHLNDALRALADVPALLAHLPAGG